MVAGRNMSPQACDIVYNEVFRFIWRKLGRMDETERKRVAEALLADVIELAEQRMAFSTYRPGMTLQHQVMTIAQEVLALHFQRQGSFQRGHPITVCGPSSGSPQHTADATPATASLHPRPGQHERLAQVDASTAIVSEDQLRLLSRTLGLGQNTTYGSSCTELDMIAALRRGSIHAYHTVAPALSPYLRRTKQWLKLLIPGDSDGDMQNVTTTSL